MLCYLSLLGVAGVADPVAKPFKPEFSGKCVDVYSGDTIGVLVGDDEIIVRLYGVDAAEEGRPYAKQSLNFLKQRVLNKAVKVYSAGLTRVSTMLRDGCFWARSALT
jgi:endonuclease YncB( thermonuclease family)